MRFRARVQFRAAPRNVAVANGYLLIEPPTHQGAPEVVRVRRAGFAVHELWFEFQRQRFDIDARSQRIEPLRCPVDEPLAHYIGAEGLSTADVPRVTERYGRNSVDVPTPTFLDIFLKQILGPVPVFQMFCTILWLLDEYWNYAIFHFVMICVLEASTAFSRLKNVTSLRGMQTGVAEQIYVRRDGEWRIRSTADLLPGDVFSVPDASTATASAAGNSGGISVPCDAIILSGSAVVNEASLTGESVPQLKEALIADGVAAKVPLDINGEHRAHVLFSGTSVMQIDGSKAQQQQSQSLKAPDNGCVCVCLRTGFASSQGTLVRMIEFSSEQVMGSTKESITLLLILLMFAIVASGYVLYNGLHDGKRTQYQLVIRCVLILTSVVPPELPMQMAVAVNTAILALWRAHVFCTEPFRVPYAGKLTAALFDKTGTLTTDQLQVVGVSSYGDDSDLTNAAVSSASASPPWASSSSTVEPQAPSTARMRLRMVLAACHSLVSVNDALVGDPTEMAASRAAGWKHDAAQHRTVPAPDSPDAELIESVQVLHTYRFASQFQRMSVLVRVVPRRGGVAQLWLLGKGSPEKVRELCSDAPPAFDRTYRSMAESGHRVLALAWRRLSDAEAARVTKNAGSLARDEAERGLHFLGFVAMSCLVRKDSAAAVQLLHGGALRVAMVTGDASLTALHVARQVAIASAEQSALLLVTDADEPDSRPPHWEPAIRSAAEAPAPIAYRAADVAQLARSHVLVVSGPALRAAERADAAGTRAAAPHVSVFARMTPSDKEMLLRWLRENGDFTLMCGDGANDVGALKQAHVGLALLSGFGTANTAGEGEKMVHEQTEEERKATARATAARQAERSKQWAAERAKDVAEMKELQQVYYREEYEQLTRANDPWAALKAMKNAGSRVMAETQRRNAERMRKFGGGAAAGGNALAAQAAWMAADMGGQDDINGMPAVKLGDASVAAPFTSKLPSIRSCVDIVRQGRCTLVSTVQNQQIMSLNAMITAYSLSALAIDGVRFGEVQMIATSLLLSVAGMAFTYARPVEQLAPTQPIGSIFHPAMALSTIGQLLIHLAMMVTAIRLTRAVQTGNEVVEQPYEPEWLTAFLTAASSAPASKKFVPTLLNTVVFLVETAQQVAVMAVNYKGRPFMLASTENSPMLISLLMCGVGLFTAASERYPLFNGALRLVQLPSDEFRWQLLAILSVSVFGALLWDRLIVAIFAPSLFVRGYVDAWRALPTLGQVAHRITIWLYWTIVVILWLSLDSLLVILAGWWFWRSTAMQRYRGIEQPPQP